ncbi:hypothetical protein F0562_029361 [Nyssa sinensis]|uniref:SHSP domain-containing protein n=1 Tax=Nyssa sinensis TaxID=561372 RepID=A0A5J5B0V8_9ASTE|nr:hypothetical protein F0562_029361 [Nyssa sinensis]
MASPIRSHIHGGRGDYNNIAPLDPHLPVLAVAPLNCVPYFDPPMVSSEIGTEPMVNDGPAMVFLPSRPTEEEWNNIMAATNNGVGLTGSAAMGKVGPILGLVDIGECDDSYLFRVSLPGVARENEFSCDVEPNGKIVIKGVTSTGEKTVHKNSQIFKMCTQNLCPPGYFSISFQLPGPIDYQQFKGIFGPDGILEGIVKKKAATARNQMEHEVVMLKM